jgi:hypothetical protein
LGIAALSPTYQTMRLSSIAPQTDFDPVGWVKPAKPNVRQRHQNHCAALPSHSRQTDFDLVGWVERAKPNVCQRHVMDAWIEADRRRSKKHSLAAPQQLSLVSVFDTLKVSKRTFCMIDRLDAMD